MKKIVYLVLLMVASSASTFGYTNEDYVVFGKLSNYSTIAGLERYLGVNLYQSKLLEEVFELTNEKLQSAFNAKSDLKAERAINFNLANARYILTDVQYRKYLMILNLSRNNFQEELLVETH